MEGGVMLSRSYGSVEPFDRTVAQLRHHFQLLLEARRKPRERGRRVRIGKASGASSAGR
jgi:hypothetical protein